MQPSAVCNAQGSCLVPRVAGPRRHRELQAIPGQRADQRKAGGSLLTDRSTLSLPNAGAGPISCFWGELTMADYIGILGEVALAPVLGRNRLSPAPGHVVPESQHQAFFVGIGVVSK